MLELTTIARDLDGNEITTIEIGQPFVLQLVATDLRVPFDREGVFGAYVDAVFPFATIMPTGENPISFGSSLASLHQVSLETT